jgi:predicted DsbA family dithiol-disulfide isomerase
LRALLHITIKALMRCTSQTQPVPAVQENFLAEGLPEPSYQGKTGNTFNSHRLIWWARTHGPETQNALVEELMMNYFCQEKFINDRAVLVAAAEKAGLQVRSALFV